MKTLLLNLQTMFKDNEAIVNIVEKRNIVIGEINIDTLVPLNRFPFIIVDEAPDVPEEFVVTDVGRKGGESYQKLRGRIFHVTVKVAMRNNNKEDVLTGDDGILTLNDLVMDAIFQDERVGGRVERLDQAITVRKGQILFQGVFLGLVREMSLTYHTIDEYTY